MDISSNTIKTTVPASWQALDDQQLYYVYGLLSENLSLSQIKTYCFFKFSGIRVLRHQPNGYVIALGSQRLVVEPMVIADCLRALDWLDGLPDYPVRIRSIRKHDAVDAALNGVTFKEYIALDNMYQGYLHGQDESLLVEMAKILYNTDKIVLNRSQKISVFYWFTEIKALFSTRFPHFLQPAGTVSSDNLLAGGVSVGQQVTDAMNAQIRALTKGDVTKEQEVLDLDVWRALTELDAQAKEYNEYKRKYGK